MKKMEEKWKERGHKSYMGGEGKIYLWWRDINGEQINKKCCGIRKMKTGEVDMEVETGN